jgi:hypothetical protein
MEAPQPSKRKRPSADSTDSTDTDLPSVFDEASLLSGPVSLASSSDGHEPHPEQEAKAFRAQPDCSNVAQPATLLSDRAAYGTLASQRSQRARKPNSKYFNSSFCTEVDADILEEHPVSRSPRNGYDQVVSQANKDEQSKLDQSQAPYPQEQSPTIIVKSQPPPKRIKRSLVENGVKFENGQTHTAANDEPGNNPHPRPLRKRKPVMPLPATVHPSSPKKPKPTPTKARIEAKSRRSKSNSAENTQSLRRSTRETTHPTKLVTDDDDPRSVLPESRCTVIKTHGSPEVESYLYNQLGIQSKEHGENVSFSTVATSRTDSTMVTSFNSTSTNLTKKSIEQYAQATPAPVSVSSQEVESFNASQAKHPEHLSIGASFVMPKSPQGTATYDLDDFSTIRFTPPLLRNGDTLATPAILERVSQQQPPTNPNETEQNQSPWTSEFEPTQATLLWNNPLRESVASA